MAGVDILASAFNGANAAFLGELYARWATDPASVDPSFADLFAAMNDDARAVLEDATGASWAPRPTASATAPPRPPRSRARLAGQLRAAIIASLRALMLIRSYRVRGHLEAQLDPLGLQTPQPHAELDPATYGFTEADLDRPIFIDNVLGRETATLREIVADPARRPIAARSASSSCTSRTPSRKPGSSARSKAPPGSTRLRRRRASAPSCSS